MSELYIGVLYFISYFTKVVQYIGPKLKNTLEVVREQDAGNFIWTTAEEGTGGWRNSSGKKPHNLYPTSNLYNKMFA